MTRYFSFDPDVELNGRTVSAFLSNLKHEEMTDRLIRHGLATIDPNRYYHLQRVLDVLSEISEDVNGTENLVAIGMAAGQIVIDARPAHLKDVTAAEWMQAYCEIYQTRHRGGYNGEVSFACVSDSHYLITSHVPYPDDVMYGLYYVNIRAFPHPGKSFVLRYDTETVRRDLGGSQTIYHVLFD